MPVMEPAAGISSLTAIPVKLIVSSLGRARTPVTVPGVLLSLLPTCHVTTQVLSLGLMHELDGLMGVLQASAGTAIAPTAASPRNEPPATVVARRSFNRFTPSPVTWGNQWGLGEEAVDRRRDGAQAVHDASPRRRQAGLRRLRQRPTITTYGSLGNGSVALKPLDIDS
jgi:hypothetical protein